MRSLLTFIRRSCCFAGLWLAASHTLQAESAFGLGIGINATWYRADNSGEQHFNSYLLPHYQLDYLHKNEQGFCAGAGIGCTVRQVPFTGTSHKDRTGVQLSEWWLRVRSGFMWDDKHGSSLLYLALGLGRDAHFSLYSKNAAQMYYQNGNALDTLYRMHQVQPFAEIGLERFREKQILPGLSGGWSIACRIYPLPLYPHPLHVEFAYQDFHDIQYHLLEAMATFHFHFRHSRY